MKEKIGEVFGKLNKQYLSENLSSTKITRRRVKKDLEKEFGKSILNVVCDETNNPPNFVNAGCIIARIIWLESADIFDYKFADFIFGDYDKILTLLNNGN